MHDADAAERSGFALNTAVGSSKTAPRRDSAEGGLYINFDNLTKKRTRCECGPAVLRPKGPKAIIVPPEPGRAQAPGPSDGLQNAANEREDMRIIAGKARGREIAAPKGFETRPVTDMIRESLFNIWQFDIEGSAFLDLFSGSGCMALEALSRGAASAVMVDASPEAVRVIRQNLAKTGLASCRNEVVKGDVFNVIGRFGRTHRTFDIVYLDPPFTVESIFLPVMEALSNGALLNEGGSIVIRSRKELKMPEVIGRLEKVREKRYGISTVHFYQVAGLDDTPAGNGDAELPPAVDDARVIGDDGEAR